MTDRRELPEPKARPVPLFAPRVSIEQVEEGAIFAPKFGPDGLLPVITVAAKTAELLMFGHMNTQALECTVETGELHYWSRSRATLWRKGETSGLGQRLVELRVDDDQDALLARVEVAGSRRELPRRLSVVLLPRARPQRRRHRARAPHLRRAGQGLRSDVRLRRRRAEPDGPVNPTTDIPEFYPMKIAYIFATNMAASYKLATMILPQIEAGSHGIDVVGMFFFDDNLFVLRSGDPVGERLAKVAAEKGILLMVCDQCAVRRQLAEGTLEQCGTGEVKPKGLVSGVVAGCFPQLYGALAGAPPDHVVTL